MDNLYYLCFVFVILPGLFIAALWSSAGKALTFFALYYLMFYCVLSHSHVMYWVRCGDDCIDS